MSKFLIIVDMQNDFVTGSLGTKDATEIVPYIKEYAESFDGKIIATQDTHFGDYDETQEGKLLPIKHCEIGSVGWYIVPELSEIKYDRVIQKNTFGSINLGLLLQNSYMFVDDDEDIDVYMCGVCTDICIISNALLIKALSPEIKIHVLSSLCAGTTPEMHERALSVMRSCLIDIM